MNKDKSKLLLMGNWPERERNEIAFPLVDRIKITGVLIGGDTVWHIKVRLDFPEALEGQRVVLQTWPGCQKKGKVLLYNILKNQTYSFKETGSTANLVRVGRPTPTRKGINLCSGGKEERRKTIVLADVGARVCAYARMRACVCAFVCA